MGPSLSSLFLFVISASLALSSPAQKPLDITDTLVVNPSVPHTADDEPNCPRFHDPDLVRERCADFCAGTANDEAVENLYICGDKRLGPRVLPRGLPLDGIVGGDSTYRRFGGLCPKQWLLKYTEESNGRPDRFRYPKNDGWILDKLASKISFEFTLERGTLLDRFGEDTGRWLSVAGTPYSQRALPPINLNVNSRNNDAPPLYPANYHVYRVINSFSVEAGPASPGFEQPGMGLQFKTLGRTVKDLVASGVLEEVEEPFRNQPPLLPL